MPASGAPTISARPAAQHVSFMIRFLFALSASACLLPALYSSSMTAPNPSPITTSSTRVVDVLAIIDQPSLDLVQSSLKQNADWAGILTCKAFFDLPAWVVIGISLSS